MNVYKRARWLAGTMQPINPDRMLGCSETPSWAAHNEPRMRAACKLKHQIGQEHLQACQLIHATRGAREQETYWNSNRNCRKGYVVRSVGACTCPHSRPSTWA